MAAGFLLLLLCWCCCSEKLKKRTADAEASLYTLSPCCLLRRPDFANSFFTASAVERRFCVIFSLFLTSGFCCKRLSTGHFFGPLAVLSLSLSLSLATLLSPSHHALYSYCRDYCQKKRRSSVPLLTQEPFPAVFSNCTWPYSLLLPLHIVRSCCIRLFCC
jgi:hypothetical protein